MKINILNVMIFFYAIFYDQLLDYVMCKINYYWIMLQKKWLMSQEKSLPGTDCLHTIVFHRDQFS